MKMMTNAGDLRQGLLTELEKIKVVIFAWQPENHI
jgi:hypothetical protein